MASIRRTRIGRWRATLRLPDGKPHSAPHTTRAEAEHGAGSTELTARPLAVCLSWSLAGLSIFIPEDLITMDLANELERALRQALDTEP
ncbi:hypothetical protein AB0K40_18105 [Nonomuraea bangladeshensis]|uniref:WYL domain-containing protein n=1 Tax=Nonomuraea bangladeshensis TaxID=404385 RepID=A0ABV3H4G5_9ACTN